MVWYVMVCVEKRDQRDKRFFFAMVPQQIEKPNRHHRAQFFKLKTKIYVKLFMDMRNLKRECSSYWFCV